MNKVYNVLKSALIISIMWGALERWGVPPMRKSFGEGAP